MRRAKGTIQVFTFKEGLLSAVAHDLQIHLEKFDITLDGENVKGEFPLQSLNLVGPVENGVVQPDKYDAGKRADVHKAMNEDVLKTDRNPTARFSGRAAPKGEGYSVSGELELGGQKGPLSFDVAKQGASYTGEFEIQPSRWGVEQYKAALGTIRLKDQVKIRFALTEA
jgi:polyisoprenoid-binding protein YceI